MRTPSAVAVLVILNLDSSAGVAAPIARLTFEDLPIFGAQFTLHPPEMRPPKSVKNPDSQIEQKTPSSALNRLDAAFSKVLIGTVLGPDVETALLFDPATQTVANYSVGDVDDGWIIVEISSEFVIIERSHQRKKLEISNNTQPPPPRR